MRSILSYQPFKGFFTAYKIALILVKIPLYTILAIPRSWRPRRSWGIRRAVLVKLYREAFALDFEIGPIFKVRDHHNIVPGVNVNGVWVEPVPQLVTGELQQWSIVASVEPARIPGYWFHKKGSHIFVGASPMPGEKVVYVLHGGGYVLMSAHPADITSAIPHGFLEHCDFQRVFALEYRLSACPPKKPSANSFPAALLDALAGYHYLVNTVGFDPSDIIIEGDSAGGNLALALTRYLIEYQNTPGVSIPPPPAGLILTSPWVDLGSSHLHPSGSIYAFRASDYIYAPEEEVVVYSKRAFVGPHGLGVTEINRYISPASKNPSMTINFEGFPRTFIIAGGAEMLYDQIVTLKEKMVKDIGENTAADGNGKVTFYEANDGVHDFLMFSWHEPERGEAWKAIAQWCVF